MNLFPRALLAALRFDDESNGGGPIERPAPPPPILHRRALTHAARGLVLGVVEAGVYMLASTVLPTSVALLLAMSIGLLFQRTTPPLAVLLLLRFEALASLEASWTVATLISAAAWSYACLGLVDLSRPAAAVPGTLPSATRRGLDALLTLLLGLAPAALLARWTGDWVAVGGACGLALFLTAILRQILRRRLAAHDASGALALIQAVAQIALVIGLLALVAGGPLDSSPGDNTEDGEEIP